MADDIPNASTPGGAFDDAVAALRSIRNLKTCRNHVARLRTVSACAIDPVASPAAAEKIKAEPAVPRSAPAAAMPQL